MSKEILDAIENVKSVQVATQTAAEKAATEITEVKSATDAVKAENEQLKEELNSLKEVTESMEAKLNRPSFGGAKEQEEKNALKAAAEWFKSGEVNGVQEQSFEKAFNTTSGATGGDVVPDIFNRNLMTLLRDNVVMRSLCNVVQTANPNYIQPVALAGTAASWGAEGGAVNETATDSFAQLTFKSGKVHVNPRVTTESIHDIFFNVEPYVTSQIVDAFARAEDSAFLTGDGVNKPQGLLTATLDSASDLTRAFGTFQKLEDTTANVQNNIIDMIMDAQAEMKAGYSKVLMMNAKTLVSMKKLKDSQGRYLVDTIPQDGYAARIAGIPVVINPLMPDVADGNTPVILGDFAKGYTILDIQNASITRNPYSNPGFVSFYAEKRVGGGFTDSQALKFITCAPGV